MININQTFIPFLYDWMNIMRSKELEWVYNAMKMDNKEPTNDEELYSSAVFDIFSSLLQSLQFLEKLDISDSFSINNFLELSVQTVNTYTQELRKEIVGNIEKQWSDVEKPSFFHKSLDSNNNHNNNNNNSPLPDHTPIMSRDTKNAIPIKMTPHLCVSVNNIKGCQIQMDKYISIVEEFLTEKVKSMDPDTAFGVKEAFESCTRESFQKIKNYLNDIINVLACNVCKFLGIFKKIHIFLIKILIIFLNFLGIFLNF